ncbi:hypothetical protein [Niastella vici]|nr:hypothetical protein [Niastella vici]
MGLMIFKVQMSIVIKDEVMEACLLFENNMPDTIYLDGMTLCWKNKIERDMFVIIDKSGNEVDYIESIKNREIKPEDFVQLNKGDQFKAIVNINEAYDLRKGEKYTVQYSAYNPSSYDPDDHMLIKMESDVVDVIYQ